VGVGGIKPRPPDRHPKPRRYFSKKNPSVSGRQGFNEKGVAYVCFWPAMHV